MWDRLLTTTVQTSNFMVRESPKWVTFTDIQATRTKVADTLEAQTQAVGRQWRVQLIDGRLYGRVFPDIIRSKAGNVNLTSTAVDPAVTEDVMQRWAKQIDAQASQLRLKQEGPVTVLTMSVPPKSCRLLDSNEVADTQCHDQGMLQTDTMRRRRKSLHCNGNAIQSNRKAPDEQQYYE